MRAGVNAQFSYLVNVRFFANIRSYSRQKLFDSKRLCHIVVSADIKTCNLINDLVARSQNNDGEMLVLTKKEFDLLVYLIENRNKVISREQALVTVWGYDFVGSTNVVDVYIRYLRAKIDDKYGINLIETVRGFGYVIR